MDAASDDHPGTESQYSDTARYVFHTSSDY